MDTIKSWIENDLEIESSGIYRLKGHRQFSYSDGADSEKYLDQVFDACEDLSSGSAELAAWIKDWRSEYHLSPKRSNLLDPFNYNPASNALEVGCGCGAISRFLGETFNNVISIEGSIARAQLARKRCRDLSNVHFISAPFQDLSFTRKFDIIFCIGVLEYSSKFVDDPDPYNSIIRYFAKHLSDDGVLVIAIENRLGLKYFNSASEDHTGRAFDSIEDYPGTASKARTFGNGELKKMIVTEFPIIDFYYPFPDYKVPDALLSEDLLEISDVSGLLGRLKSRDYAKPYRPLFSESRAWRSLAANGLVSVFSNSFLVVAKKSPNDRMTLGSLGVTKNLDRTEQFRTRSTIYVDETKDEIRIKKCALQPTREHNHIDLVEYDEPWREGDTLQDVIEARACEPGAKFAYIFEPAKNWYAHILELAGQAHAESTKDTHVSVSSYFDAIWQNTIVQGKSLHLIDQEWTLRRDLSPRQLLIRAIFFFVASVRENRNLARCLRFQTGKNIIQNFARLFDEEVSDADIAWLIDTESSVYSAVTGKSQSFHQSRIRMTLFLPPALMRQILRMKGAGEYLVVARHQVLRLLTRLRSRFAATG